MISTAVVAAAGKGTRMLDLAKDNPKQMIPINGKPFLYYLLSNLRDAGITRIIIVVGHLKEKIEQYIDTLGSEFVIECVDQFDKIGTEKYGTACPIGAAEGALKDQSFISVYGDNLYAAQDIRALMINDRYTYVSGLSHEYPERYGALVQDDGYLSCIIEKPTREQAQGYLVNIGLYKFTTDIFEAINRVEKSVRGEYELTDAVTLLSQEKKVRVVPVKGPWLDLGKPEDVAIVDEHIKNTDNEFS